MSIESMIPSNHLILCRPVLLLPQGRREKCKSIYYSTDWIVWASLIAQLVKNPLAMQETPVQSLGQEDPLEKGQATHSSILGLPLWLSR